MLKPRLFLMIRPTATVCAINEQNKQPDSVDSSLDFQAAMCIFLSFFVSRHQLVYVAIKVNLVDTYLTRGIDGPCSLIMNLKSLEIGGPGGAIYLSRNLAYIEPLIGLYTGTRDFLSLIPILKFPRTWSPQSPFGYQMSTEVLTSFAYLWLRISWWRNVYHIFFIFDFHPKSCNLEDESDIKTENVRGSKTM